MDRASEREIDELIARSLGSGHLYIVANRAPEEYRWRDGRWAVRHAPGGLVSLLEPLYRRPGIRWLACAMTEPERELAAGRVPGGIPPKAADLRYVVPAAERFTNYYGVIANELLWPVQHSLWSTGRSNRLESRHHEAWDDYRQVNRDYAERLAAEEEAPVVLVQDYHLYLVPGYLRRLRPQARILHFTHIPWPSLREWEALPREFIRDIFTSLSSADVVGFQTDVDRLQFLAAAETLFGHRAVDHEASTVTLDDRRTLLRVYPAAPDFAEVAAAGRRPDVRRRLDVIAPHLGSRTILRVDRLDPAKNQLLGFEAFRQLLIASPRDRDEIRFLACLIPSRTDVKAYQEYRDEVFALVDAINAEFAAPNRPPPITVLYVNDRKQAMAAMLVCDVLLANSVADGMNLVVKEALILSEKGVIPVVGQTMGVAQEMERWLLPVAASDVWGTARALRQALDIEPEVRSRQQQDAREHLQEHDLAHWIIGQLRDLGELASAPNTAAAG